MQIKRFLAGSLAAVMVGAALTVGGLATLGDYVATSDGTLTSPMIVVGDSVPGSDVVGAADIAAAVAGYATTPVTVSGASSTAVSNGVSLSTQNSQLYLSDAMNTSKTTLTSSDLPAVLKSGVFSDDAGTEYKYDQYLVLGSRTTTFGNSGGDIQDPEAYVNVGTTATNFLYTSRVVFNKALNISANTDTEGNSIAMFGKDYTITSGSTATKLILFDSSNAQTFTEGEPQTVTVGTTEYTVTLEGVSSDTAGVVTIAKGSGVGISRSVTEGNSYKIEGLDVVVEDLFYFGSNKINKAKLSFGTGKLTFEHGQEVKVGTDEEPIDNTLVTITGDPMSTFEVSVAADDSETDHAGKITPFTDTVFKSFKTAFGGFTPALDDAGRSVIKFGTAGDATATITSTDYRGNEKTVEFGWDTDTVATTMTPALNSSDNYQIHVKEGEVVLKKDYVVLSQGDFGHLFQVASISSINSTTAKIDLKDVWSGETITINMQSGAAVNGYTTATAYIDGQTYYVNASANSKEVIFTWGAGAAAANVGTQTSLYPFIKGRHGEDIALLTTMTGITNGTTVYLPGGNTDTGATQGTTAVLITNTSNVVDDVTNWTYQAGQLYWNVTTQITGATSTFTVWGVGSASNTVRFGDFTGLTQPAPAVLVLEEKGKDSSSTEVRDAIIVPTSNTGSDNLKMSIGSPVLTAGTSLNQAWKSNTYKTSYMDRYGTLIVRDSQNQALVDIYYPDVQAIASVAIGSDPSFSTTAGGQTIETALKITNPVAKFANEINVDTLTSDLILVGGPCANALVETLAATDADIPTCADWDLSTGVIKEVADAFVTGHKALVVAGSNAADTRALAANVMTGTLSFSA